jgi:Domain of unknown function (DUF4345)
MHGKLARMSRRGLQIVTGILAAIPVATGLIGLLGLRDPLYVRFGVVPNVVLDSNLRFFSGVWLGIGIAFYWMIPSIQCQSVLFRALWGMIFLGGIGRLASLLAAGTPPAPFLGVLVLELVGAPFFVLWQRNVARASLTTG